MRLNAREGTAIQIRECCDQLVERGAVVNLEAVCTALKDVVCVRADDGCDNPRISCGAGSGHADASGACHAVNVDQVAEVDRGVGQTCVGVPAKDQILGGVVVCDTVEETVSK